MDKFHARKLAVDLGLRGRRALVGGGSSGVGFAIASALASEGCDLVLWSSREERLRHAAMELRATYKIDVFTVVADNRNPDSAQAIVSSAADHLGVVDIAILNGGGPPAVRVDATDGEGWQGALQMLTLTPIAVASAVVPGMRKQAWGRIVAVLSSGIRQPIPELSYSNAGRLALAGWLKTLAGEVAQDGITVNGLTLGRIATERATQLEASRAERDGVPIEAVREARQQEIPAGRYGEPTEVASVAVFLASERASYVTGAFIAVDGGLVRSI